MSAAHLLCLLTHQKDPPKTMHRTTLKHIYL